MQNSSVCCLRYGPRGTYAQRGGDEDIRRESFLLDFSVYQVKLTSGIIFEDRTREEYVKLRFHSLSARTIKGMMFGFGIILAICGYLVAQADNVEWIGNIVNSHYVTALNCWQKEKLNGPVYPSERGFEVYSKLLLEIADAKGHPLETKSTEVESLDVRGHVATFGLDGAHQVHSIQVKPKNKMWFLLQFTEADIEPRLDALRRRGLAWKAALLFAVGILLQLATFFVDRKPR